MNMKDLILPTVGLLLARMATSPAACRLEDYESVVPGDVGDPITRV